MIKNYCFFKFYGLAIIILCFLSISLKGQSLESKIDFENVNNNLLQKGFIDAINKIRQEKSLSQLKQDDILTQAGLDQSKYNRKLGSVEIEQDKMKKALPADRVKFYKGLFYEVNEYDLGIELQTGTTLKKRKHPKPSTYQEVIDYGISNWLEEKKLNDLLFSDVYFRIGVGISANEFQNLIFISIVLGSERYEKYPSFKYNSKAYKIRPYDRNICKSIDRNYSYLPELLSNNLKVEGNRIRFYYHDLSLMENILESRKDALAVDILFKDQFSCNHGNYRHPSAVHDGMMLKPVKKNKLLKGNKLKDIKEFSVDLGGIPSGIDTSEILMSLMVIKDKCMCTKIMQNDLNGKNIRLLKLGLAVDTISITQDMDSNAKYLAFTIPFEKGKYNYQVEDIKPFLDSIQLNRFNIKEIDITAYSSIEGNLMGNLRLQQKRAESILTAISEYQLQTVKTKVESHEDWKGFQESIKGSPYQEVFKNLDKEEARSLLNADTFLFNIEPYLVDQRRAEIQIFVESIYIDSLTPEKLPSKFRKALEEDHIRAKALQTLMYRAVLDGHLDTNVLFDDELPQKKLFVSLSNNRLAFRMQFDKSNNPDSLIDNLKMEVEALLGVEPGNGHLNFNKQTIKLYYWAKDLNFLVIDVENHVDQPKDFFKDIRKLYNTKIDNYKVNRLLLNYNIIAADFYYERKDYKKRVKALKQVKKYVLKAELDRDQTLIMARYFIYQMQIEWAVQIMYPFLKRGDIDADFLSTFLSIIVYHHKKFKLEDKYQYFELAAKKYPDHLCGLFKKTGMSLEFLSDLRLKSIYCSQCN